MTYAFHIKLNILEEVLKGEKLSRVARNYGIPERTVRRWVSRYRDRGIKGLVNDRGDVREKMVWSLKEEKPWLTLREIRNTLKKRRLLMDEKKIWFILKKYELVGFDKKEKSSFLPEKFFNREYEDLFRFAEKCYRKSRLEECALILNFFPSLPFNTLLPSIPDKYLNLRRRIDKLEMMFISLPPGEVAQKANKLIKECRRKKLFFQYIRLFLIKSLAYQWIGQPMYVLKSLKEIEKITQGKKLPSFLYFFSKFLEAHAYAFLMKKEKLNKTLYDLMRGSLFKKKPYFYREMSAVFSSAGNFKKAFHFLLKIKGMDSYVYRMHSAVFFAIRGEYDKALEIIEETKNKRRELSAFELSILSRCHFGKGNLLRALEYARECLERSKERERKNLIFISSVVSASIYNLLNEKKEGEEILNSASVYLLRDKNYRDLVIIGLLLDIKEFLKGDYTSHSNARLISMLKKANEKNSYTLYKKAFEFAQNKWIKGYFHLFITFFPELVKIALHKNKNSFIPEKFFYFPQFKNRTDFIKLNFLGKITVFKDNRKILEFFSPSELAILIYLALNSETKIRVNQIIEEIWRGQKKIKSLYQCLWKIRKKLDLRRESLFIRNGEIHCSLKFLTDYHIFKDLISKAKSFYYMEEYRTAENLFNKALKLLRGEVFRKIYNPYLDFLRMGVIFEKEKIKEILMDIRVKV